MERLKIMKCKFILIGLLLLVTNINIQLILTSNAIANSQSNTPLYYQVPIASETKMINSRTLVGPKNFFSGYPAKGTNKMVNAIIEIPAGQNEKWEISKKDGKMHWELQGAKPRIVSFLPYPFNYGIIPSTYQSKETGGDGDPIDVLVLGPAIPRGSVVKVSLIGVLRLQDNGERDDKLLAVTNDSPFKNINSLHGIKSKFPGVLEIIEVWLTKYKGKGRIVSKGYANHIKAQQLLNKAIKSFKLIKNK